MSPSIRFTRKMLLCISLATFVLQFVASLFSDTATSGKVDAGFVGTHNLLVMQQQADIEMNEHTTLKTLYFDIFSMFLQLERTETPGTVEAFAKPKGFVGFTVQQSMLSAIRKRKVKNISITDNMGRAGPDPMFILM